MTQGGLGALTDRFVQHSLADVLREHDAARAPDARFQATADQDVERVLPRIKPGPGSVQRLSQGAALVCPVGKSKQKPGRSGSGTELTLAVLPHRWDERTFALTR
jgi:hypothetical protein